MFGSPIRRKERKTMTVTIRGFVTDSQGRGLDNTTVIFGDKIILCAGDGSFTIAGVPKGRCEYKILHRDHPTVRGSMDVQEDAAFMFQMRGISSQQPASDISGIRGVKRDAEEWLLESYSDVAGVGISIDRTEILVYVKTEEDGDVPDIPELPQMIGGFPVRKVAMTSPVRPPTSSEIRTRDKFRPICGGISAAHYETPAGTLGAVMYDRNTEQPVFLSNNHIFARCSSTHSPRARIGDPILQPSPADGGTPDDIIGELARWIPYHLDGVNLVDAAIASPRPKISMDGRIFMGEKLEQINGIRAVTQPIRVKMCGRTTGCGWGRVVDWDFTTIMEYPTGENVKYVDQLLIDMPAEAGDSGAVLLDDENNIVGLLNGTTVIDGKHYTVANKIRNVMESLDLELPKDCEGRKDRRFGAAVVGSLVFLYVWMSHINRD